MVFYGIFYLGLAALFAVCMKGLLMTLSESEPKWKLGESLIGINPGLGFRPIADDVDQGSLIWYDATNQTQIGYWTTIIDNFLEGKSKI
jgi:sodium/potassium-transporting ATPase subunit beta